MTDIPADWRDLPWPALRSVASKVSSEPIRNRADAVKAIELASRAPVASGTYTVPANVPWTPTSRDEPVKFTDIPADWHETMTVAQIITLASQISPDGGNAVEIIQAEVARRSAAAT